MSHYILTASVQPLQNADAGHQVQILGHFDTTASVQPLHFDNASVWPGDARAIRGIHVSLHFDDNLYEAPVECMMLTC